MILLGLIVEYLRRYRGLLIAVVVLTIVHTTATLTLPSLNADIIDKGVITGDHGYIWRMGAVMLAVSFTQVVFAVIAAYFGVKAATGLGRDIRAALFHRVTSFSAREVATFGPSSLITRITNDVQQVQMLVLMVLTMVVAAPITLVGAVGMAIREDGPLSMLLIVVVPAMVAALARVIVRLVPEYAKMQVRIDRINEILAEQITGMRVVRAFVREPHERARFATGNDALTETSLRAGRLMAFMFPTVMMMLNVSSAAALWVGGDRIGHGQMQIGALIAFLTYLMQILMAVMVATFVAVLAPRAAVCAQRIREVLDTHTSVVPPESPVVSLPGPASVEFRDVGFSYPGAEAPVLTGLSFRVEAGTTTAIVGSTGSGKTTLLGLVPRLFDVTAGEVLVNGVDVRLVDAEELWRRLGLVPQKPYLFTGTVASNVRYGKPDATDAEVWDALEIAQARSFVEEMPGRLDEHIVQGGTNVSGGQRQRLAIARAVLRRPEIYLFDDSFSALDLATDARLRAALAPVTRDSAVLVVAQRISTIIEADQILVLEDGHQVGLGTHSALLETCETYAEIVDSQLSAAT